MVDRLSEQRGQVRRRASEGHPLRHVVPVRIDADPDDNLVGAGPATGLDQDPGNLAAIDKNVVKPPRISRL